MKNLNVNFNEITLIISFESQKVQTLKCKKNDTLLDILKKFATKMNEDYNSFLILYSGKVIEKKDFNQTFDQFMCAQDKKSGKMNILIYKKNQSILPVKEEITIILIINLEYPIVMKGKRSEMIKDIYNRYKSKTGIEIESLIFSYGNTKIDVNKKFEEIANKKDKNSSGMTLSAQTINNKIPLKIIFVDSITKQKHNIDGYLDDKIKIACKQYCSANNKKLGNLSFKYGVIKVNINETYKQLISKKKYMESNMNVDVTNVAMENNEINEIYNDEIEIIVSDLGPCLKRHKKLLIILSSIIIISITTMIIIIFLKKPPEDNPTIDSSEPTIAPSIIETEKETEINSYSTIKITEILTTTMKESTKITTIVTDEYIDTIINPKKCEEGYFIPDDDLTLKECQKCSIKGCSKCKGTYGNDECINCGNLINVYNSDNKIIKCNYCEIGSEEKCLECNDNKIGCKSCNIGYKLVNNTCRPDFFIKAVYKIDSIGKYIDLFNTDKTSEIQQMIIDGEKIKPVKEFQFFTTGNHTVYYKFQKSLGYACYNFFESKDKDKILTITFSDFNEYKMDLSFISLFSGCINLISVDLSKISLKINQQLNEMFSGCKSLVYVNFNSSNIIPSYTVRKMFYGCSSLTSIDLSRLNMSSVSTFEGMFSGCFNLRELNIKNFELKKAINIKEMFSNCNSLVKLDLSIFRNSKIENMNKAFYNCNSLTSINFNNFYVSQVYDMSYLFYNCTSLKLLNLTTFDTGNVKYMKSMFERCTSLTSIILGNNFVSTKVENMDSMFHNCHFLESIDYPISIGDKVYNLTNFFSNCYSLTSINLEKINTSKISYYTNMFYNCYKLKNIDASKFLFKSQSETKFMFSGCFSLTSIDFSNLTTVTYLTYSGMFFNCPNLIYLDFSFVSHSYESLLFNSNISSNGTLIFSKNFYDSKLERLKIYPPSNWTLKLK